MYTSNASWTKIEDSQDTHDTKEQAMTVCDMLMRDYGDPPGCPIRGMCTLAWIKEVKEE